MPWRPLCKLFGMQLPRASLWHSSFMASSVGEKAVVMPDCIKSLYQFDIWSNTELTWLSVCLAACIIYFPLEKLWTRKQRGQLDAEMVKANTMLSNQQNQNSVYFHISWLRLKRYMAFWVLALESLERCSSQSSCQDGIKSEDLPQVDDQTPSATWICVWQTSQSQICHHADPHGSWRGSWGRQRRSMGQAPLLHHVHLVCVCSEVI